MIFPWSKRRRRENLLSEPLPDDWSTIIQGNLWQYAHLTESERSKLQDDTRIIVAEKEWVACGELEMTDEIRVTIAAQAALLLAGFEPGYYFDGIRSVLVYPSTYMQQSNVNGSWVVYEDGHPTYGEAWHRGPVVLSWDNVLAGGRSPNGGCNLVFHELAHHVDGLDGDMDGVPPLPNRAEQRRWFEVAAPEFRRHVQRAKRGEPTLLDEYGATNEAEFFAVATEAFFQSPVELSRGQADLYQILATLYRQDPATRLLNRSPQ